MQHAISDNLNFITLEQMKRKYELQELTKSDECSCPEEHWVIGMMYVIIHMEPDFSGHIFLDGGDYGEAEKLVDIESINHLRYEAVKFVDEYVKG